MKLLQKLEILADAAKYDASCASSAAEKRDSTNSGGIGSTSGGMGICHSYTPDGRCVSLLKILLTNFCQYECAYCVNRTSSNVPRARFTVAEVVKLTLEFYKRNYIEGLFLSSGIIQSANYTMEQVVEVARTLRLQHSFAGYIHLKTIPEAAPELLAEAGLYADRLSINVELPSEVSLKQLAPEKNARSIERSMANLDQGIRAYKASKLDAKKKRNNKLLKPAFSPSGQSTQMIVGADQSTDATILQKANGLYRSFKLKRVYYSAFSPIPDASSDLPLQAPPLVREHRLYQADWLLRFYGFTVDELAFSTNANGDAVNMLALDKDPKLAWALANRELFPINLNTADYEQVLRVPGIGVINARRIIRQRRIRAIRYNDLIQLKLPIQKIKYFVSTLDHHPHTQALDGAMLDQQFSVGATPQLTLF
ncbi:putative DNA modification/repair radical SAM protein [Arenicella xantha]|uniref:putative DNA modification/repair radical SAM protein n=1 Tax=Arenicella xantha TaxID=644221 RepID=UPI000DEA842D